MNDQNDQVEDPIFSSAILYIVHAEYTWSGGEDEHDQGDPCTKIGLRVTCGDNVMKATSLRGEWWVTTVVGHVDPGDIEHPIVDRVPGERIIVCESYDEYDDRNGADDLGIMQHFHCDDCGSKIMPLDKAQSLLENGTPLACRDPECGNAHYGETVSEYIEEEQSDETITCKIDPRAMSDDDLGTISAYSEEDALNFESLVLNGLIEVDAQMRDSVITVDNDDASSIVPIRSQDQKIDLLRIVASCTTDDMQRPSLDVDKVVIISEDDHDNSSRETDRDRARAIAKWHESGGDGEDRPAQFRELVNEYSGAISDLATDAASEVSSGVGDKDEILELLKSGIANS